MSSFFITFVEFRINQFWPHYSDKSLPVWRKWGNSEFTGLTLLPLYSTVNPNGQRGLGRCLVIELHREEMCSPSLVCQVFLLKETTGQAKLWKWDLLRRRFLFYSLELCCDSWGHDQKHGSAVSVLLLMLPNLNTISLWSSWLLPELSN